MKPETLIAILLLTLIGCKDRGKIHKGICITCPDTCVTKLTDGVWLVGVGSNSFKQTITCDCGDGYFSDSSITTTNATTLYIEGPTSGVTSVTGTDSSLWEMVSGPELIKRPRKANPTEHFKEEDFIRGPAYDDGLEPVHLNPFKPDTIYIYRDTCIGTHYQTGDIIYTPTIQKLGIGNKSQKLLPYSGKPEWMIKDSINK